MGRKLPLDRRRVSSDLSLMENELRQEALFELQGPDEEGCVWACSPEGRDVWCTNLGPTARVAEVMSQWLGSIDNDEAQAAPPPLSRRLQERENKAKKLSDLTARRDQAAVAEEDEIDRMIRQNIADHGA